MNRLKAIIAITRPLNVGLTGLVVFSMVVLLTKSSSSIYAAIAASAAAALSAAAGNIINDIYDVDSDKINHPERPLITGGLSIDFARRLYWYLVLLSIAISFFLPPLAAGIVFLATVILYLYSYKLQHFLLVGNLLVALLTALAFVFAGVVANATNKMIIPAVFGFLVNLIRELVKDMQDRYGDQFTGSRTFAILVSRRVFKTTLIALTILLVLTTWLPFFLFTNGIYFSALANITVNPVLLLALKNAMETGLPEQMKRSGDLLKLSMLIGLGVICLWI